MTSSAQNSKQSLAQQGSATVPAYSFLGDQDTGTYRSAANEFSIATNATQRVVVNSSGNVGIGTSSPVDKLDVSGGAIRLDNNSALVWGASGYANYISGNLSTNSVKIATNGTERMSITSAGYVGIGTSAPNSTLSVQGAGQTTSAIVTSSSMPGTIGVGDTGATGGNGGGLVFSANSEAWKFAAIKGLVTSGSGNSTGDLAFSTRRLTSDAALTEAMRITSAGYVGIGTSSPPAPLSITSSLSAALSSVSAYGLYIYPTSSGTNYIDSLNASPNGSNIALRTFDGTSIYTTTIVQAGAAYQGNNSTLWSVVSDINIKTNIRSIGSALEKIIALMPRHFEYKDKLGKVRTGFIAQDFEEVFPGHVGELDVPDQYKQYLAEGAKIKTIDPDLIPYIVAAIQELSAKNDALEARLAKLDNAQ
jgi:hypothetical protein